MKKVKYKSKLEENVAKQLKDYCAFYEPHKYKYIVPSSEHTYTPDFYMSIDEVGDFYIECKGGGPLYGLTTETKQKMLLVKAQNPDVDIRFCFSNAYLLTGQGKGKPKITYGEWCDNNGFKYCEQKIPKEWLRGYK